MNRLAGIVVGALGLIIILLSVTNVLPGLVPAGVWTLILGGLIIGLSFVRKPDGVETEPMSTQSTLVNIFFSPSEVFQNLRSHPRWLVAVLIMSVLAGVYSNLFTQRLTPEKIVNHTVDKTLEMSMIASNEQARQQVESGRKQAIEDAKNPVIRAGQILINFAGYVVWFAFLAAVFLLFSLAMGSRIQFWQAFSVAVYASFPVAVIRFVLNTIVLYIKDPIDIHPILGQSSLIQESLNFLVSPAVNPVIFSLLSGFSLFGLYWIWLNATGLKSAGERVSGSAAWTITLVLYAIGILFMCAMGFLFPSFIS